MIRRNTKDCQQGKDQSGLSRGSKAGLRGHQGFQEIWSQQIIERIFEKIDQEQLLLKPKQEETDELDQMVDDFLKENKIPEKTTQPIESIQPVFDSPFNRQPSQKKISMGMNSDNMKSLRFDGDDSKRVFLQPQKINGADVIGNRSGLSGPSTVKNSRLRDDSDDEFEKLIRESMGSQAKRQNPRNYETLHQRQPSNLNLDDLLSELNGSDQRREKLQKKGGVNGIYYNQESIKLYRQNSNANRRQTKNKFSQEKTSSDEKVLDSLNIDALSTYLKEIKEKYLSKLSISQDGMLKKYANRNKNIRTYEIFTDSDTNQNKIMLKTNIQGLPVDGRLIAVANFQQQESVFHGYSKLGFEKNEAIVLVSASLDNSYLIFGFKETPATLSRTVEVVDVFAVESTTVRPKFEVYPPGSRFYKLKEWEDIGFEISNIANTSIDMLRFNSFQSYDEGEIGILHEIFLVTKDFNPEEKEPLLTSEKVRVLSLRVGELLFMTIAPNKGGWFEGYRANDPDRLCGIAHKSFLKKINFK
ncbi:UNKNOWN [Stylonychia lemnae]|uniref:Uncharacterized protein n=1 Tax=Stylonychia lemnae TaxID=5949 RepID=A0A078ANV2_STYLE|nr:UNKNOWN [Stylonychia lemnae]|eukprot:CDW84035.1 UNKNOWN [Stylonychia lemnae]